MSIRERFSHCLDGYVPDDDMGVGSGPASDYIRSAMLEAIRELDPQASLQGWASIRLIGDRFSDGVFDAGAAEMFGILDRELRAAAAPDDADNLLIGFRAVQPGSVTLPLEPFARTATADDQVPSSALETALLRVVDLHEAVESDSEPAALGEVSPELAKRLRLLVEALDKADASLEIDVSRTDGRRTKSQLTSRGRANARRMFARQLDIEVGQVCGYLESITLNADLAKIELRVGKKKVPIVRIPAEIAKTLPWDVLLTIEFRSEVSSDSFGQQQRTERQFIRRLGHQQSVFADHAGTGHGTAGGADAAAYPGAG